MEEQDVVKALTGLAQPMRLRVFRALVVAGPEGLTPGVLVETMDVPASSLSFHLKELVNAGLVTQERNGRNLVYRTAFDRMQGLIGYLTENCCQGVECVATGAGQCGC